MGQRLDLHAALKLIVGDNVYYQPPANVHLVYPCIIYERSRLVIKFGNNKPYKHAKRYKITVIYQNPDDMFADELAALPLCTHDSYFTADNLNHDIFTIYF